MSRTIWAERRAAHPTDDTEDVPQTVRDSHRGKKKKRERERGAPTVRRGRIPPYCHPASAWAEGAKPKQKKKTTEGKKEEEEEEVAEEGPPAPPAEATPARPTREEEASELSAWCPGGRESRGVGEIALANDGHVSLREASARLVMVDCRMSILPDSEREERESEREREIHTNMFFFMCQCALPCIA